MSALDDRGRLFGRFNVIDAAALVFLLLLIPTGYAAYMLFRVPPPTVSAVEPNVLLVDDPMRVRIRGTNFLPYLSAYVSPVGTPLTRYLSNRAQSEARFLIESPGAATLELPALPPGRYDLYLYSEAKELLKVDNVLTVEAKEQPVEAPAIVRTVANVRARLTLATDIAEQVTAGGVDTHGVLTGAPSANARVVAVDRRRVPNPAPGVNDHTTITLDLTVPVTKSPDTGLWLYKDQRVRVGESLVFGTPQYLVNLLIVSTEFPPGVPWDTDPR